jgi:hypothetical protein
MRCHFCWDGSDPRQQFELGVGVNNSGVLSDGGAKNALLFSLFVRKRIILPRQAGHKRKETVRKECRFS